MTYTPDLAYGLFQTNNPARRIIHAFQQTTTGTTVTTFGAVNFSSTGTSVAALGAGYGRSGIEFTSAGGPGAQFGVSPSSASHLNGILDFNVLVDVTIVTLSDVRIFLGAFSAFPSADTLGAGYGIGLRYSTGAPDTNWQVIFGDGSSEDTVDSGVVVGTGRIQLGIQWTYTPTTAIADVWINSGSGFVKVAHLNSSVDPLPVTSGNMGLFARGDTLGAGTGTIVFHKFYGEGT